MSFKKIAKKVKRNYFFISIFLLFIFIGSFSIYKLFIEKPTYIYVKINIGQRYWWANTLKPTTWIANAITKGDETYDLLNKTEAKIISVKHYPTWANNQVDVSVTLLLKVSKNNKTGGYDFNRSPVAIGSPIQITFPKVDIIGNVTEISDKPFQDKYVDKVIFLVYHTGYNKDFPYRYDTINLGDTYFDGEDYSFKILDKRLVKNIWMFSNNNTGQAYEQSIETVQNIEVKAKIRVREINNEFYYGDYKIITNASVPFATSNFVYEGFEIRKIL